jgi:hypothetical protein
VGSIAVTRKGHFVRLIRAPPPGETSGSPAVDPAGKLLGYRGADTDVTERKAARQLIHRRQRRLPRALEVEVVVELFSGGFVRADNRAYIPSSSPGRGASNWRKIRGSPKPESLLAKAFPVPA